MKKLLIILSISLSVSQIVKAQSSYEPLVDTNKMWSVLFNLSAEGQTSYTVTVRFSTDTVIGANTYKKVIYANDSLNLNWYKTAYIREDTALKKVYLMDTYYNEGLLYDFSLSTNDTVSIFNPVNCNQPMHLIAASVDTVFLAGKNRKRIIFNSFWGGTVYEGIGSLGGVTMFGRCMIGGVYDLLCYLNNDTVLYTNPVYNSCNVVIPVGINEQEYVAINISPNPSNGFITIELPGYNNAELEISNVEGQLLQKLILVNSRTQLNIKDFSGSIFFFKIKNTKGVIVKKIIKLKSQ